MSEQRVRPENPGGNQGQEPASNDDGDSENSSVTISKVSDFEMDTEDLIDSDIRKLLNNSIPHAGSTKENLASQLVEDPLGIIEVA